MNHCTLKEKRLSKLLFKGLFGASEWKLKAVHYIKYIMTTTLQTLQVALYALKLQFKEQRFRFISKSLQFLKNRVKGEKNWHKHQISPFVSWTEAVQAVHPSVMYRRPDTTVCKNAWGRRSENTLKYRYNKKKKKDVLPDVPVSM